MVAQLPPVAVIVPAMRRPHNVAPLVKSLRDSCAEATPFFVCDPEDGDEMSAVIASGAELLVNYKGDPRFAIKANWGYLMTDEPWLLFVGDDVKFHPGWYDNALAVCTETVGLVSTNDLCHPGVMSGQHATHPLMRRDWIDEHGASWDGPGVVAHEGYRHWYVDNEWTTVALQDKAFVYAHHSVVEHLHPAAGKANWDEVYDVGTAYAEADKCLWRKRQIRFAGA